MSIDKVSIIVLDNFFKSIGRTRAWEVLKKTLDDVGDCDCDKEQIQQTLQTLSDSIESIQDKVDELETKMGTSTGEILSNSDIDNMF